MRCFRIAAAHFSRSRKAAFSGEGGVRASARWHTAGQSIIYTSQSLSLAALEILVHLKQSNDLQPFNVFAVDIPDDDILVPHSYPRRWATDYKVSRAFGDAWLKGAARAALRVPSVITPGEWNCLLNPVHPDFSLKWVISGPAAYTFDARLLNVRRASR